MLKAIAGVNANPITLSPGVSNGYNIGASTFVLPLGSGQEALLYGNAQNPVIGSGAKIIAVAGTGSQTVRLEIVLG